MFRAFPCGVPAALSSVVAKASSAAAVLALDALPPMLADTGTAAFLALIAHPPMLTDAAAAAVLALATLPAMRTGH